MTFAKRISVPVAANSARTATAAVISYWVAGLFRLPEAYWATISTLVVMQSTLGAAWKISIERLAGTVLGAMMGALLAEYFPVNVPRFGLGVFALGIVCAALRLGNAYRLAGVTLAVIMLVGRTGQSHFIASSKLRLEFWWGSRSLPCGPRLQLWKKLRAIRNTSDCAV